MTPASSADPAAVRLVSDLVAVLGATPLFCDALEHDGLVAAVDQLPSVLALALLETVLGKPSWRELRKLAGAAFEASSNPGSVGSAVPSELWLANRENLLRWLDEFSDWLALVRKDLIEGDGASLAKRLEAAQVERNAWLETRAKADWDERVAPEMPEKTGMTDMLFGSLWRRKPRKDE
jgi:prephenate dehydrogenase